jgi:putative endonuclease
MFVYILATKRHGTLYIGVTNDLQRRLQEHRDGSNAGFTKRYKVHRLVHYEIYESPAEAIMRETHIKKWRRDWKSNLIERDNPDWEDLPAPMAYCAALRVRRTCLTERRSWMPAFAGMTMGRAPKSLATCARYGKRSLAVRTPTSSLPRRRQSMNISLASMGAVRVHGCPPSRA